MTADLRFEFLADKEKHQLTVIREFNAPQQLVWECHTKSELLDQWFAPSPLTARTKHMDFRPRGYWHFAMVTPDGQEYWTRIDYRTIDPIDGYTAYDAFSDASGGINPDMPRSAWEVAFADQGGRTLVTTKVTYVSAEDLQKAIDMGLEGGLTSTMARLDALLEMLAPAQGG